MAMDRDHTLELIAEVKNLIDAARPYMPDSMIQGTAFKDWPAAVFGTKASATDGVCIASSAAKETSGAGAATDGMAVAVADTSAVGS